MLSHSFYGGNSNIYLRYETLSLVIKCKQMEIKITDEPSFRKRFFREEIGAERKALSAAKGLVSQGQLVPPTILSKLFPLNVSAQDGILNHQVEPAGDQIMNGLDEGQRTSTWIVQNLPRMSHKPFTLSTIGHLMMKSYIAIDND